MSTVEAESPEAPGLAKLVDDDQSKTSTGVTMGSPYYISPEQIRSAKGISFDALCEDLASEIADEDRRRVFVERCRKHRATVATNPTMPTEPALDLAEEPPDDEETPVVAPLPTGITVEQRSRVERELIRRIGPLGKILIARAAKKHDSLAALGDAVSGHVPDEGDRKAFLRFVRGLNG